MKSGTITSAANFTYGFSSKMTSNYSVGIKSNIVLDLGTALTTLNPPSEPNVTFLEFTEGVVALALNEHYLWVLFCFGFVFNTAAVLTIAKLRPFTTSSLYVILLAVFDTLALLSKLMYLKLTYYNVPIGDAGCKVLTFVGSFLDQFSIWILTLLTIERFVAVWLPLKVSQWFTMYRARAVVVAAALCLILINSPLLFLIYQEVSPAPHGIDCAFYPSYIYFARNVWYWTESCLSAIIPCITLIILNALIIYKLRQSMEKQKQMVSGNDNSHNVSNKTHLTLMLVTVSVAFVILMLPLAVFNCVMSTWVTSSPHEKAQYFLTREFTHFLADCNHGCNFLFYFLSSKRFRAMFYRLVRCRCDEAHRPIYSGTSKMSYYKSAHSTVVISYGIQCNVKRDDV